MAARGSRTLLLALCLAAAQVAAAETPLAPKPAPRSPHATDAMILGAAWAGERAVAVGEHGIVLLTEPDGATRQSTAVPVDATLTAISFADPRRGWAVGHWGAILNTEDGGEHWFIQRLALREDRPLFGVHFFDARQGVAVGLWSLVLTTDDGGRTWQQRELPPPPGAKKADLNLMHVFADRTGTLYATAERGMVLRSTDRGASWSYLATGYKGSFWTGIALADGTLLVGGQRGSIWRSDDGGAHWAPVPIDSKSSITAFAAGDGEVVAVGLDGLRASSSDGGRSFATSVRDDRLSLTATLRRSDGRVLQWSRRGPVESVR